MLSDNLLERSPLWKVEIGPGIGGPVPFVPPRSFIITPPNLQTDWMQLTIDGPGYTDAMAALQRPWLSNMGRISLEFDIMTDGNAPTKAQALEADIRICDPAGYNYNGSWQLNYQQGGEIQVYGVKPNPAWVNTGLMPGKYAPFTPYHVRINYSVDAVKHTFSLLTTEINGQVFTTPTNLLNIPGDKLSWVQGNYVQLQSDIAFKDGSFTLWYKNVAVLAL